MVLKLENSNFWFPKFQINFNIILRLVFNIFFMENHFSITSAYVADLTWIDSTIVELGINKFKKFDGMFSDNSIFFSIKSSSPHYGDPGVDIGDGGLDVVNGARDQNSHLHRIECPDRDIVPIIIQHPATEG